MVMELITVRGVLLSVFSAGIAVGRLIEKIERSNRQNTDEENIRKRKNNRR